MRGRRTSIAVRLLPSERAELERIVRSTTLSAGLVRRARLILLLDQDHTLTAAAAIVGLTMRNARKWALRFCDTGIEGLQEQPGRGRKPVFSPRGRSASGQNRLRVAR